MVMFNFQGYNIQCKMWIMFLYLFDIIDNQKYTYTRSHPLPWLTNHIHIGNVDNPLPSYLKNYFLEKRPGNFFSVCMIFD